MSQARKDADSQMSVRIKDPGLRAWLLMNMRQDPKTKEIGWKINIDGIHAAFIKNIARFPEVTTTCERWASQAKELFVKCVLCIPWVSFFSRGGGVGGIRKLGDFGEQ